MSEENENMKRIYAAFRAAGFILEPVDDPETHMQELFNQDGELIWIMIINEWFCSLSNGDYSVNFDDASISTFKKQEAVSLRRCGYLVGIISL